MSGVGPTPASKQRCGRMSPMCDMITRCKVEVELPDWREGGNGMPPQSTKMVGSAGGGAVVVSGWEPPNSIFLDSTFFIFFKCFDFLNCC
jgi:hypothetical protein